MREYLRQERISFRYMPIFIFTRTIFLVLMIFLPAVQFFIMLGAYSFSYGFRCDTEAEYLLPLSDDEVRKMRLSRGNMVWIRFLLIAMLSNALAFLFPESIVYRGEIFTKPMVFLAYFVLEMTMIYEGLLEKITGLGQTTHRSLFQFVFYSIPMILLFSYTFSSLSFHNFLAFFMEGSEWIHVLLLLTATVLMAAYSVKIYRDWKLTDYHHDVTQSAKQKGERG